MFLMKRVHVILWGNITKQQCVYVCACVCVYKRIPLKVLIN